jgi:hypothetical protein
MDEIVRYLIRFLLGEDVPKERSELVGYTADAGSFARYRVVIVPSGFFGKKIYGTPASLPALPLQTIEGAPLLFGEPVVERAGETLVVRADLIAGAYFLLSRYEETVRRDVRDAHGRFPGRESLPFRAGFIQRPVVDEYGRLLRRWLRETGVSIPEPPCALRRIYLTHDVDRPFACRTWRSVARGIREGQSLWRLLRTRLGALENDPYYTFPRLLQQDRDTALAFGPDNCHIYLFYRAGGNAKEDRPHYDLNSRDIRRLYDLACSHGANPGLHASYQAGKRPSRIRREKKRLEKAFLPHIYANRHHFLAAREPEDMAMLERLGFEDDFTMGYADVAGFRLGTARPVRWINAARMRMGQKLVLHPLTVMDSTLSEPDYMGLTAAEALAYCEDLMAQVRRFNGELVLLWHNTSVAENAGYLKDLYAKLLHLCTYSVTESNGFHESHESYLNQSPNFTN